MEPNIVANAWEIMTDVGYSDISRFAGSSIVPPLDRQRDRQTREQRFNIFIDTTLPIYIRIKIERNHFDIFVIDPVCNLDERNLRGLFFLRFLFHEIRGLMHMELIRSNEQLANN